MEALGSERVLHCRAWLGSLSAEADRGRPRSDEAIKATCAVILPRKEVIQPHVPVRLPCYDFVPVTSLTLDACLACALAQRLQVLPASMT
jgi:hypothetical protein